MSTHVDSRRRFLRNLLCGATTLALAPVLLHGEDALAGDPAAFARGLRDNPWLAGWKSVDAESLGPTVVEVEGRLPSGFAGTLYRNGPAWTERDGFRYEHWFDGDGMVHGWKLGDGKLVHHARMVATPKFTREQKAGRFLYPTAGTTIPTPAAFATTTMPTRPTPRWRPSTDACSRCAKQAPRSNWIPTS